MTFLVGQIKKKCDIYCGTEGVLHYIDDLKAILLYWIVYKKTNSSWKSIRGKKIYTCYIYGLIHLLGSTVSSGWLTRLTHITGQGVQSQLNGINFLECWP